MFILIIIAGILFVAILKSVANKKAKEQEDLRRTQKLRESLQKELLQQDSANKYEPQKSTSGIDSLNPPPNLSSDFVELLQKVAVFCGTRYITQADIKKYTIHSIASDFESMPGWNIWDASIHEAEGQYERLERAAMDRKITTLCYDSSYKLAKIQGRTNTYLTNCRRCSCPDYRSRRLPCKHMYILAMELDGDVEKNLLSPEHNPSYGLKGLKFALVGHLPKEQNDLIGIRRAINSRGGDWSENVTFSSSAAIVGQSPSANKMQRIESFDMEMLSPEAVMNLFTFKQPNTDNVQIGE